MKCIGITFIVIIMFFSCTILIARFINANRTKITTANGIQESIYVNIGGIKQYVQIRGNHKKNSVILWLHGGPGFPLTYLSHYYQIGLEDDYTFVCLEQRGCGRTYYKNKNVSSEIEVTPELLLKDIDELVDYIKKRFGQEKVIIMAHSWGSVLGSRYVMEHPDKVLSYVGIGQVIDFHKGKVFSAEKAMESATAEDAKKLSELIEKFSASKDMDKLNIKELEKMIVLSLKYHTFDGGLSGLKQMWLGISSPTTSFDDFRWFFTASNANKIFSLQSRLMEYMYYGFHIHELGTKYDVPAYFISGDNDWISPYPMVEKYYEVINAPSKELVIIKNTGHTPFLDKPEDFCKVVKRILKK